ncbi:hypothetical protein BGZ76_005177 [Entomortierella beljakovae]|nr:hypothetical protein BGZ76_005177 [Entomortierella beljakovae]
MDNSMAGCDMFVQVRQACLDSSFAVGSEDIQTLIGEMLQANSDIQELQKFCLRSRLQTIGQKSESSNCARVLLTIIGLSYTQQVDSLRNYDEAYSGTRYV